MRGGRGGASGALAMLLAGCVAAHPPLVRTGTSQPRVRAVALPDPDLEVIRLGVGWSGNDPEMTETSRGIVRAAVEKELAARGLAVVPMDLAWRAGPLAEPALLLDAIADALAECRRGMEQACRDLSWHGVGSLEDVLPAGADAVLVVLGSDEVSTGGRIAAAALVLSLEIAILVGIGFLGGGITTGWPGGIFVPEAATRLSAALLARDGELLWWGAVDGQSCCDLRTSGGAQGSVRSLLRGIPAGEPPPASGRAE